MPDDYFSLSENPQFYRNLFNEFDSQYREKILKALRDVVFDETRFSKYQNEEVFKISLMRYVSEQLVRGQLKRALEGKALLTRFDFKFKRNRTPDKAPIELQFDVIPNEIPCTNVHAIIGRNGIGKTTLLQDIIEAVSLKNTASFDIFFDGRQIAENSLRGSPNFFGSVVLVSFSAFDSFCFENYLDSESECPIHYVGLKAFNNHGEIILKTSEMLRNELRETIVNCLSRSWKRRYWLDVMENLERDVTIKSLGLKDYVECHYEEILKNSKDGLSGLIAKTQNLSSGYTIVLMILSKLIELVEEKTLVLIDEPESHLHPPLLSFLIRSLSSLMLDTNGVSILVTHSPVVLQELPQCCVWEVNRSGNEIVTKRPDIETFGENVSVLTKEVFGLELYRSGFYDVLKEQVNAGLTYDEIMNKFHHKVGMEARLLLKTLLVSTGDHNEEN